MADRTLGAMTPGATALLISVWLLPLSAIIIWPWWTESPTVADDLTRYTVRIALAWYFLATYRMLRRSDDGQSRAYWSFAWASYLVHLIIAFHFYHHWSHADAVAHTEEVSGFGPGIWFSHLFTALWTADVIYWWRRPAAYVSRARWITWTLHGYMAFIIFNATVIFETGVIRLAGAAMFLVLAAALWARTDKSMVVTSP
jgi:hypothetical protein